MFDCPVTDDDRYTSSALSRQKKLVPGVSLSERNTNLHGDKFPFLRRIEVRRVKTDQFLRRNANHFSKTGVRKDNARTVVRDDNAFVEHFQYGPHTGKPFGFLELTWLFKSEFAIEHVEICLTHEPKRISNRLEHGPLVVCPQDAMPPDGS